MQKNISCPIRLFLFLCLLLGSGLSSAHAGVCFFQIHSATASCTNHDAVIEVEYSMGGGGGPIQVEYGGTNIPGGIAFGPASNAMISVPVPGPITGGTARVTITNTQFQACSVSTNVPMPTCECQVVDIMVDDVGSCDPETGFYTTTVTVVYTNPGTASTLRVNGFFFPLEPSPQTVEIFAQGRGRTVDVCASIEEFAPILVRSGFQPAGIIQSPCVRCETNVFVEPDCPISPIVRARLRDPADACNPTNGQLITYSIFFTNNGATVMDDVQGATSLCGPVPFTPSVEVGGDPALFEPGDVWTAACTVAYMSPMDLTNTTVVTGFVGGAGVFTGMDVFVVDTNAGECACSVTITSLTTECDGTNILVTVGFEATNTSGSLNLQYFKTPFSGARLIDTTDNPHQFTVGGPNTGQTIRVILFDSMDRNCADTNMTNVADCRCDLVLTCPSNLTVDCSFTGSTGAATARVACVGAVTCGDIDLGYTDSMMTNGTMVEITRVWTAAVDCATNSPQVCTQIIMVAYTNPPVVVCPGTQTVYVTPSAIVTQDIPLSSVFLPCGGGYTLSPSQVVFRCANAGLHTQEVMVTDDWGNQALCTSVFEVLCCPTGLAASLTGPVSYDCVSGFASMGLQWNGDDATNFTFELYRDGASWFSTQIGYTGAINVTTSGVYTLTNVTHTSGCPVAVGGVVTVDYESACTPMTSDCTLVVMCSNDATAVCGSTQAVIGSSVSISCMTSSLTGPPTRVFTTITEYATNCISQGFVFRDHHVTMATYSNLTASCTQTITYTAEPFDLVCTNRITVDPSAGPVQIDPVSLVISNTAYCTDPALASPTGMLTYACEDAGTNPVMLVYTDACGQSATCNVDVVVTACTNMTTNCTLAMICPPDLTITCTSSAVTQDISVGTATAQVVCMDQTGNTNLSISNLCGEIRLGYMDISTNFSTNCAVDGYVAFVDRLWTASVDCVTNTASCTQRIYITPTPLEIECVASITVDVSQGIVEVDPLTLVTNVDTGCFDPFGFVAFTTSTSPIPYRCPNAGTHQIEIGLIDFCGNTATCTVDVVVVCDESCGPESLVITEALYTVCDDSRLGEGSDTNGLIGEWVKVCNTCTGTVDLMGLTLDDSGGADDNFPMTNSIPLDPGQCAILAGVDQSTWETEYGPVPSGVVFVAFDGLDWPTFGNTGDEIHLSNAVSAAMNSGAAYTNGTAEPGQTIVWDGSNWVAGTFASLSCCSIAATATVGAATCGVYDVTVDVTAKLPTNSCVFGAWPATNKELEVIYDGMTSSIPASTASFMLMGLMADGSTSNLIRIQWEPAPNHCYTNVYFDAPDRCDSNNTPPVITCPTNLINVEVFTGFVTLVTDADLGLSVTDDCDQVSASVSQRLTCAEAGTQTIQVVVTDSCGASSTCDVSVLVTCNTNPPPPDLGLGLIDPGCFCLGGTSTYTVIVSNLGLTAVTNVMVVDSEYPACSSNLGSLAVGAVTQYTCSVVLTGSTRTVTASGMTGGMSTSVSVMVESELDTNAPVIVACPSNETMSCGDRVPPPATNSITATDDCSTVTMIQVASNVTRGCSGSVEYVYTVVDACGNEAVCTQTISIIDNDPPVFDSMISNLTLDCGDSLPGPTNLIARDTCEGTIQVSVSSTNLPTNCTGQAGVQYIYTAMDSCSNQISMTQTIVYADTNAPILSPTPSNMTIGCDESLPGPESLTASDRCSGDLEVSVQSNVITAACALAEGIMYIYSATDTCSNVTTVTQMITRTATGVPGFSSSPDGGTFDCDDDVPAAVTNLTATDGCGNTIDVHVASSALTDNCLGDGVRYVYSATDACGAVISHTQDWTFVGSGAPGFNLLLRSGTVICTNDLPMAATNVTASDACGNILNVEVAASPLTNNCLGEGVRYVYSATDVCGVVISQTQDWTFVGNGGPSFNTNLSGGTIMCGENLPVASNVTATDGCGNPLQVSVSNTTLSGNCVGDGVRYVYSATDNCGERIAQTQDWAYADDNVDPSLSCPTGRHTILTNTCITTVPNVLTNVTAMDACSTVTLTQSPVSGTVHDASLPLIITVTATDGCNNRSQCYITNTYQCVYKLQGIVWEDANDSMTPDEVLANTGLTNIPVTVRTTGGVLVTNGLTVAEGRFCFLVPAGNYLVTIDKTALPSELEITTIEPQGSVAAGTGDDILFGYNRRRTAVDLLSFQSIVVGTQAYVHWQSGSESENLGYKVWRGTADGPAEVLPGLIPSQGRAGSYALTDDPVHAFYWLESIATDLSSEFHGPAHSTLDATAEGEPVNVIAADEGVVEFTAEANVNSYLITGLQGNVLAVDLNTGLRLKGTQLSIKGQEGYYLSVPAGMRVLIQSGEE